MLSESETLNSLRRRSWKRLAPLPFSQAVLTMTKGDDACKAKCARTTKDDDARTMTKDDDDKDDDDDGDARLVSAEGCLILKSLLEDTTTARETTTKNNQTMFNAKTTEGDGRGKSRRGKADEGGGRAEEGGRREEGQTQLLSLTTQALYDVVE